jgi:hypothetical protein
MRLPLGAIRIEFSDGEDTERTDLVDNKSLRVAPTCGEDAPEDVEAEHEKDTERVETP